MIYSEENFGHVVRADNLCTSILHGRIAGTRKRGRPRRRWTDDIKDWTELPVAECVRTAQDRTAWRAKVSLAGFGLRPSGMRKNQSIYCDVRIVRKSSGVTQKFAPPRAETSMWPYGPFPWSYALLSSLINMQQVLRYLCCIPQKVKKHKPICLALNKYFKAAHLGPRVPPPQGRWCRR